MGRRSERWLAFIMVVGSVVLCLATAEVALRFLPVASGMRTMPVTEDDPVFHFRPDRDFVFSRDWNMSLVNRGHVNNAGFVNDQDYRSDDPTPLMAVVGDSYIEAAMVPFGETVQGRLAKALSGKLRVYSFGASGAPLSQYLVWAGHAVQHYRARALVINVVGNDFDESLAAYNEKAGFALYVRDASDKLQLKLFKYVPGGFVGLISRSALARYLVFNLQAVDHTRALWIRLFGATATAAPRYMGNTAVEASPSRVSDSLAVIDAFFRDLATKTTLPPDRVLFTIDGFRYPPDAAAGAGSYFDQMRQAFRAKGEAFGYEIIDLDPAFFARHGRTSERFEYPTDGHWNPAGHEVAFDAVMGSRLVKALAH
jgi:hypothetical protein